jgi:dCTP deaminase
MSALSAAEIRNAMNASEPGKRLVISPILDIATQLKANQAALDVRLGRVFTLVKPWSQGAAETLGEHGPLSPAPPVEPIVLDFGEPLIIHPHQFVLARTLEVVRMPDNLLAYVLGRSSWGRRGLIVATAVVVHPGFAGPITLELKNVGEVPLAMLPMDRVAQLVFHTVEVGKSDLLSSSQFASTYVPELGQVRDAPTAKVLTQLVAERHGRGKS